MIDRRTKFSISARGFCLFAALASPVLASGNDQRISDLLAHDSFLESLDRMRHDFLQIATEDIGFPGTMVAEWRDAVNDAFNEPDLRRDYLDALEEGLTEPIIVAVTDFNASDLRAIRDRITGKLLATEIDHPALEARIRDNLEDLPGGSMRGAEDLFAQYGAPFSGKSGHHCPRGILSFRNGFQELVLGSANADLVPADRDLADEHVQPGAAEGRIGIAEPAPYP